MNCFSANIHFYQSDRVIPFLRWLFRFFTSHQIKKNIYITEIYMEKQYKSPIIKSHKIPKIFLFGGFP